METRYVSGNDPEKDYMCVVCPDCGADLGAHDVTACSAAPGDFVLGVYQDHQDKCPVLLARREEDEKQFLAAVVAAYPEMREYVSRYDSENEYPLAFCVNGFMEVLGKVPAEAHLPDPWDFPWAFEIHGSWTYQTLLEIQGRYGRDHVRKIRRRIEDRLRKDDDWAVIETAMTLSIQLSE